MGSESNRSKHHYDISMSKRTRKPLNLEEANENPKTTYSPEKEIADPKECGVDEIEDEGKNGKSLKLKQLMNGNDKEEEEEKKKPLEIGEEHRGRSSLGQHFTSEETQLQMVRKQGAQGMKLKGMVGRYAKMLGHMIKAKRDHPRNKKPLLNLRLNT